MIGKFSTNDIVSQPRTGEFHSSEIVNAQPAPERKSFSGVHFSDSDPKDGVLNGARRGASGEGSETERLHLGSGGMPGVHVYAEGSLAHPRIAKRKFAHKVQGDKALADISDNDVWHDALQESFQKRHAEGADEHKAYAAAINDAERALHRAGFDGYYSSNDPGSVLLFGDQQVVKPLSTPEK